MTSPLIQSEHPTGDGPAQKKGKENIQKEVVGRFQDAADLEATHPAELGAFPVSLAARV